MFGHLIKRNPLLSGVKKSFYSSDEMWFVQTKIDGSPSGSKSKIGETIYLYEVGYAVWASGEITEVNEIQKFNNIEDLLQYSCPSIIKDRVHSSSFKNTEFWGRIILEKAYPAFVKSNKLCFLSILEVKAKLEVLKTPIPLEKNYMGQSSWVYLKKPLESLKVNLELSPQIPSFLRRKVFDACSLNPSDAFYDIDHFVPKSIGGPGNIVENLQPIGSSLNRIKSDSIPSAIFDVAYDLGYTEEIGLKFKKNPNLNFLNDNKVKNDATKIITHVNSLDINAIRFFYREVRRRHRPAIDELLNYDL
jgi:hypothetical protein